MEREEFLNSALSENLHGNFVNLNWDQSMEQTSQFDSALSSIVSSPSNPTPQPENVVIRELIGRLGSICNSGEMSPQFLGGNNNSTNTSCYSTPLNSPPKLGLSVVEHHHRNWGNPPISGNPVPAPATHLGSFSTDPGFAERAARFSCFGGRSYTGLNGQFAPQEVGKLSRVSSSKSLRSGGGSQMEDGDVGIPREEQSMSDRPTAFGGGNVRKRKAVSRGKAKEAPKVSVADSSSKKSKSAETKLEQSSGVEGGDDGGQEQEKDDSKPPEPPKQDYIHVRARRGQATDSHSLAERVRREKISERMKFLQDLVPGCNKITGKAVMLDEIINYVQSLQRQVEFLSMKLAAINPRLELNVENIIQKDMHGSLPHPLFPVENSGTPFPFAQQHSHPQSTLINGLQSHCTLNPFDATIKRSLNMQLPALDGFRDAASMIGTLWEDDLQSFVQMSYNQNQDGAFSSQSFHGAMPTSHMKIEL